MDASDNPYEILGVTQTATLAEIKTAYRKLALQHHPDRTAPEDQASANVIFSKISNAYEVLSDEQQRREYDYTANRGSMPPGGPFAHQQGAWQDGPQQQHQYHHDPFASSFFQHHNFHDPFQVFEQVFREEFGNGPRNGGGNMRGGAPGGGSMFGSMFGPGFMDPFASDPFFNQGRGANHGMMMDPFGGRGMFGGGGGMMDPFGAMGGGIGNHHPGLASSHTVSSSTTTTIHGGRGGESVTTQTTRRFVNGREEAVTERIVRKADGSVTRQVLDDTTGRPAQQLEPDSRRPASRRIVVEDSSSRAAKDHSADAATGHKHGRRDTTVGRNRSRKRQEP